jgi:hypothetical protein
VVGQGGAGKSTLARGLLQDVGVSDKGSSGMRLVFFVSGRDSGDVSRGYRELSSRSQGCSDGPLPRTRARACTRHCAAGPSSTGG